MLGLNATVEDLGAAFRAARTSKLCRGFAVGRTIFQEPSRRWLGGALDDDALVAAIRERFEALIRLWQDAGETSQHPATTSAQVTA